MTYKFIYLDGKNKIVHTIREGESWCNLVSDFCRFLKACGFLVEYDEDEQCFYSMYLSKEEMEKHDAKR